MTEKQKRFCDEYLIDLNATRAYKAAYPNVKKDETAKAAASRLLTFVNVADYIQKRQQDQQERTEVTQDIVIQELCNIAFAEASDGNNSVLKYKNKLKALELLGRHMGMFSDKLNISTQQQDDMAKMDEILMQLGMLE